ncbi:beta-N-acetylhexosaminidase [Flavobacterium sp. MXW15]|uniref:beta-N-acetylhexosaminidase n=1 Tax=Xanthomonas chitinilytica TaxID=2989819 RepID=A0ABT3JVX5_9XANT|nr:beta-N-acetylhexosaminidase [Xanthomonas sp. H13-6]MCW4454757.1 beta-N-acetylhexosaminidase [Flavobacterium sp. MXW15]MCW4472615.1 beta-N-acetylhexosaminidase [Xanthomonas sp. H13-6]
MKLPIKPEILLACLFAVVGIVCGPSSQAAAAVDAAAMPHLVPVPQSVQTHPGELRIAGGVVVDAAGAAPDAKRALAEALAGLGIATSDAAATRIRLQLVEDAALGEEGYRLVVADDIRLSAQTDVGLLHAVQSLRQLLPARAQPDYRLPRVAIADSPAYRWRGLSLDVARSFLPVEYLEKTLDRMAFFKLNRLHLHLTDDQGWRIEIKRYPKLVEIGGASAVKGGRSGFYTQEELRQLVAYAQARGVTLVPEIDMPGHVQAALASYNELACDDVENLSPYSGLKVGFSVLCLDKPEVVYPFVRNVLEEVMAIFPSQEIHIGGDEIKHPLYADFVARTAAMVEEMGRTPIAWEEGSVADTGPQMMLQLWNDGYAIDAAVAKGHPLILSPCSYFYIDHGNYAGQPETYDWCRKEGVPLARLYGFDPAPFTTAVGIEAALWTELVHTDAAADNRLWPRLAATAELAWSRSGQRDYAGFAQRMGALRGHLDAMGVGYHAEPDLGWDERK